MEAFTLFFVFYCWQCTSRHKTRVLNGRFHAIVCVLLLTMHIETKNSFLKWTLSRYCVFYCWQCTSRHKTRVLNGRFHAIMCVLLLTMHIETQNSCLKWTLSRYFVCFIVDNAHRDTKLVSKMDAFTLFCVFYCWQCTSRHKTRVFNGRFHVILCVLLLTMHIKTQNSCLKWTLSRYVVCFIVDNAHRDTKLAS